MYVVEAVKKGENLGEKNARSIRPGFSVASKHSGAVLGRTAARDIKRGPPMAWNLLEGGNEN